MKMKLLLFFTGLAVSTGCHAQLSTDTIITKRLPQGGYRYYHGDIRLNNQQLVRTVKSDPLAKKTMQSAQTNEVFGTVLSASGGALIGFPVGTYIAGGKMQWGYIAAGVAVIICSYPLYNNAYKLKRKSISQFNEGVNNRTTFLQRSELNIAAYNSGVGLTWRF
ncbi:MAG: hypothetical protein BGO31_06460 [Bacteroidetes bacterium 43-16]|nr:MAG: hypothetical protein BGO31_06460 [Bacteroidetes bacterium 43-16]